MIMKNLNRIQAKRAVFKSAVVALLGLTVLVASGCEERGADDGTVVNALVLPTDVVLNLACENVGIYDEQCVLTDPENPFALAVTLEFDVNNPDGPTKFDLAGQIPAGPAGAKSRFYLFATALARRQSGENQWLTARALHELFDANSTSQFKDELIRAQALKAYRSVLDNFFGSVIFFECCANISVSGNDPVAFSVPLNELTADDIYRTAATGFMRLVEGDPLLAQSLLAEWGYTYQPATPPNFDNGVVTINEG